MRPPGTADAQRVLLVDDHQLLADSLALALEAEGFVVTVADLTDREQLIASVRNDPPDLVLLDLDLGGTIGDGATLVRPFCEAGARVLVVSGSADGYWLGTAVEQGAAGVLTKSGPFEPLLANVMSAARGDPVMSDADRHRLINDVRQARERLRHLHAPLQRLTEREQEVLRALGHGKSVSQIAEAWFVSEATVRSQVRGVLTKLGVSSQLEAVAYALRAGWLTNPDDRRGGRRALQ